MSTNKTSIIDRVGDFFELLDSARAAAAAFEAGTVPKARHLQKLGIKADQFRSIGRF